jgi:hypothetical protein
VCRRGPSPLVPAPAATVRSVLENHASECQHYVTRLRIVQAPVGGRLSAGAGLPQGTFDRSGGCE